VGQFQEDQFPESFILLGEWLEWAHIPGGEKGRPMALDTTTFLIIFAAALVVMGLVVWLKFRFENKRRP
jgi:hypothetical protein